MYLSFAVRAYDRVQSAHMTVQSAHMTQCKARTWHSAKRAYDSAKRAYDSAVQSGPKIFSISIVSQDFGRVRVLLGKAKPPLSWSFMKFCWRFFWAFWLVSEIALLWLETRLSLNPPRCSGCNVVRVVVQCCTSVLVYYNVLKQCWLENTSNEQEQRQSCGSRGRDWTRVSGASLLLFFWTRVHHIRNVTFPSFLTRVHHYFWHKSFFCWTRVHHIPPRLNQSAPQWLLLTYKPFYEPGWCITTFDKNLFTEPGWCIKFPFY